tara:strand:+ start:421 stop:882 length:462 start_codon:yes stop_codon:yes gene_type:complete
MAESIFKSLGPHKYSNMMVKGMLEYKLKPWEVICEIIMHLRPDSIAREKFKSIASYREWLEQRSLGRKAITEGISTILPKDWSVELWSGFGYSYDHSPKQLTYDNTSDFNITIHLDAPNKEDWRDLKPEFEEIAHKISNLPQFSSNKWIKIFY